MNIQRYKDLRIIVNKNNVGILAIQHIKHQLRPIYAIRLGPPFASSQNVTSFSGHWPIRCLQMLEESYYQLWFGLIDMEGPQQL